MTPDPLHRTLPGRPQTDLRKSLPDEPRVPSFLPEVKPTPRRGRLPPKSIRRMLEALQLLLAVWQFRFRGVPLERAARAPAPQHWLREARPQFPGALHSPAWPELPRRRLSPLFQPAAHPPAEASM